MRRPRREILDAVATHERRPLAPADAERRHVQREIGRAPRDRRDREVIVLQRVFETHVGPRNEPVFSQQERLDRGRARPGFECAVFREQAVRGAAVDADDGPIALLSGEAARVVAARRVLGEGREKGVGRGAECKILDVELRESICLCRPVEKSQAQVPRLRFGQQVRVGASATVGDAPHGAPLRSVVGELDVIAGRVQVG